MSWSEEAVAASGFKRYLMSGRLGEESSECGVLKLPRLL